MKRLVRWLWLELTGEDPEVVSGHFWTLATLNAIHCEFLIQLESKHPDLWDEIEAHKRDRLAATDTPNTQAEGRLTRKESHE